MRTLSHNRHGFQEKPTHKAATSGRGEGARVAGNPATTGRGFMCPVFLFILLSTVMPATLRAQTPPPGLTVSADGTFLHDGKPFRGIGVDYYSAFYRLLLGPDNGLTEKGFTILQQHGIPFARVAAMAYWPTEMKLYQTDRNEYWKRLDIVVQAAEQHHVGLILSIAWNDATIPDMVGEPADAWGNPASKTRAWMRDYARQLVTRYKDSPAIWGWEFGNEFNLRSDLPNAETHRPQIEPTLGTPTTRTSHDDLHSDGCHDAFIDFAKLVRTIDLNRMIESGDSVPRPSAWHQHIENSWKKDSTDELAKALSGDCPDPLDAVSVHLYEQVDFDRLSDLLAITKRMNKPLFVGEFGVPGPPDKSEQRFNQMLKAIVDSGVQVAAVWEFTVAPRDEWSVTADNDRSYQLHAIEAANKEIQQRANP